ncbi:hypothetical protein ONE63_004505 [Megalurothrips usitatus]|uniref:Uncharacterized protein n=1 Tax=Megalurothrips usitatus TaxID=439358 RepID=A0AAV7X710_9NEOP|nr:hypothetical protein ONE63_004505 [Megalurothrips usitatus]
MHALCGLAKARADQLPPLLETLQRGQAAAAELVRFVRYRAAVHLQTTAAAADRRLQQEEELVKSAQKMLQDRKSVEDVTWNRRISALQKQSGESFLLS